MCAVFCMAVFISKMVWNAKGLSFIEVTRTMTKVQPTWQTVRILSGALQIFFPVSKP